MRLEATTKPIRYRFKDGREVLLTPGVPVELPGCRSAAATAESGGECSGGGSPNLTAATRLACCLPRCVGLHPGRL